ncbi:hypothetical protein ALC60_04445 [Trachymyrmex zeteki]|uniref:Uncharacterized protein n=1 Tax=Mycetomoellerius zeteki TaxID=64791 RepID=A0A151X8E8_9HYME|nr:hypothetical protein ALC60_04445 [Trachymyrmex zeteki]
MALTSRCRASGGENLSEELVTEDEGTNGSNFEPLSDSCGESDMEGLDLSLFEPQVDTASWCDSRIHAGTLHILVHYCAQKSNFRAKWDGSKKAFRHEAMAEIIRNEHVVLIGIGSIKTRKLFGFDIPITPDVLTGCCVARSRNRGWKAIELTDCRILYEAECCVGEAASEACWEPCYCVLLQDEQTLTAYRSEDMARRAILQCAVNTKFGRKHPDASRHYSVKQLALKLKYLEKHFLGDAMFVELPRVRLDGGARAFRQHWGYETRPLAPPPPLIEEDEAAIEPETVSLREANTASPIVIYSCGQR